MRGWIGIVAVPVVATGCYLVRCLLWPFAVCGRCAGSGRRTPRAGNVFGLCRRCKGAGRRLRVGRRAFNYFTRLHDRAVPSKER